MTKLGRIFWLATLGCSATLFVTLIILMINLEDILSAPYPIYLGSRSVRSSVMTNLYLLCAVFLIVSALIAVFWRQPDESDKETANSGTRRVIISLYCTVLFFVSYIIIYTIYSYTHPIDSLEGYLNTAIYLTPILGLLLSISALATKKHKLKGSWRYAAMINTAVLVLTACLAIVHARTPRDTGWASEAGTISALRTISSAQEMYYERYGTYSTFAILAEKNMLDDVLAGATTPASAKSGFYFTMEVDGSKGWRCIARPGVWRADIYGGIYRDDNSYTRNFMVDQTGVIYLNEVENSSEFTKPLGRN